MKHHSTRAALAVALLLAPCALAVLVAAALVATAVILAVTGHSGAALGCWLAIAVVGVAVGVLAVRLRRNPPEPDGISLGEETQPSLWTEVRALAQGAQTRAPDEIRLVAEPRVRLVEDTRRLGLAGGTRRLLVGVPLLEGLTRDQMRGLVAHELFHLSTGGGTATARLHRAQAMLARTVGDARLGRLRAPLRWHAGAYAAVVRPLLREREVEADRVAARVAGPETAAAALRELPVLRTAWGDYLEQYVALGAPIGMRPTRLFDGFAAMLADPRRRRRLNPVRIDLPEPPRKPYDAHATLAERIAALAALAPSGTAPVSGSPDESGRAVDLLHYPGQALMALEDRFFAGSGLMAASLGMVVARVGAERAAERSRALLDAMERHRITPATLEHALTLLAEHRPEPLLDLADLDGVDPYEAAAHQRTVAGELLGHAIASALVVEEKAAYQLSWSGVGSLVDPGGNEIDPHRLAFEALDSPGYAAALRAWLHQLDVRLDAPAPPAPEGEAVDQTGPTGYLGAIAPVSGHGFGTFLVTDAGLMLVRPTAAERLRLTAGRVARRSSASTLVKSCLARPAPSLAAESRAVHASWAQIRALHVSGSQRADLTLRDGRGWTLSWASGAEEHGTFWPPIEHYLGHRFTTG